MDWFKHFNFLGQDYVVSKVFVYLFVLLSVGLGVYVLSLNNFSGASYFYSSCPVSTVGVAGVAQCFNIFYHSNLCGSEIPLNDSLCTTKFLLPGQSLGTKPPFLLENFYLIIIVLATVLIVLNHVLYNKGFRWVS